MQYSSRRPLGSVSPIGNFRPENRRNGTTPFSGCGTLCTIDAASQIIVYLQHIRQNAQTRDQRIGAPKYVSQVVPISVN